MQNPGTHPGTVWSRITDRSARWEQAYTPDDGQTWEVNWIMDFTRQE